MNNKISWADKYALALQEELTVKEIELLRSVGQSRALKIRESAIDYCLNNNIEVGSKRVPTSVVLLVTNKGLEYYYEKMKQEAEMLNLNSKSIAYALA